MIIYGAYGYVDKEEKELKMKIQKLEDTLLRSKNYRYQERLHSDIMKCRIQLQKIERRNMERGVY